MSDGWIAAVRILRQRQRLNQTPGHFQARYCFKISPISSTSSGFKSLIQFSSLPRFFSRLAAICSSPRLIKSASRMLSLAGVSGCGSRGFHGSRNAIAISAVLPAASACSLGRPRSLLFFIILRLYPAHASGPVYQTAHIAAARPGLPCPPYVRFPWKDSVPIFGPTTLSI